MSNLPPLRRAIFSTLVDRLAEAPARLQIVSGPRQVGKTTVVRQALVACDLPSHYASADDPALRDAAWLAEQWEEGRRLSREHNGGAVLAIDEVQKVGNWAEMVKRLWDEDRATARPLRVVLLGSAALLIQHGLSESLTGRFELIRAPHWSFGEMRDTFGFSLEQFVYFGGYPGAATLVDDEERWASYVLDSIVETTISRDLLLLTRVDKPALLRGLFRLVCDYSSQIVSYQKLTGQLQDAGNTTTLAHYLDLLAGAGLAVGLEKYSPGKIRQRRSTPKLLALNTALVSATSGRTFAESRESPEHWGRLVETAIGAHLWATRDPRTELLYWRNRNREVDFVLSRGDSLTAIEVKSGRRRDGLPGMSAFESDHGPTKKLLVGGDGTPLDALLLDHAWRSPKLA
ncbi:MAG TPA: ATP-binding protein [Solirubrobacterales bacterium]|nr:ATP-binding protein [Solirubrobacterales bacterium]